MRLVFMGTPDAAVVSLRALVDAGHEVVLVVTRADARRGRGAGLDPSPVKAAATELGLAVTDRPGDAVGAVEAGATLGVVVAYGRLIRPAVLERLAMVNVHFSLLPRWRGAAPVERAILAGDPVTGVCLMALEETLDTGGVYRRAEVDVTAGETAEHLRARLATVGAALLVAGLAEGLGDPEPQGGDVTYAAKIDPSERHLDWSATTEQVHRTVRIGRAWTSFRDRRLLVHSAVPASPEEVDAARSARVAPGCVVGATVATGDGALRLVEVQPEGKKPQPAEEWRRGARPADGERLA